MKRPLLITTLLVSGSIAASGAEPPEGLTSQAKAVGISFELLADVAEVVPGRPFRAGVRIVTEPGYHTYWKAPGVVGFPTSIEWELPEGFTAGELQWPAPEPVLMLHYKSHGYAGETMLFADITPPETLSGEPGVSLAAKVSWMACARGCFPGHVGMRIDLPVSAEAGEAAESPAGGHFAAAAGAVPKDLEIGGLSAAFADGILRVGFILPPEAMADAEELSFIPEVSLHDPNVPHQVETDAAGNTVIILPVMDHAHPSVPPVLTGLLHRPGGWPQLGGARFGRVVVTLARDDD